MQKIQIRNLNSDTFSEYGVLIGCQPTYEDNYFKVIISEPDYGWRIAVYIGTPFIADY